MYVLITISKIFAVVDHLLYIDWLVELFSTENRIYTYLINIKIPEIRLSKSISYLNLPRTEDQLWTGSGLFKCEKVLRLFNIIFNNLRFMFDRYLIMQNMKKSESVFVIKYTWISLWISIWQRWTFVNVLVNTFYLDPSSESFFYSISFSSSMWFGITKKVSNSWFSLRCHLIHLCTFFHNFALIFYLFFFFDRNCGKAKVSLISMRIDFVKRFHPVRLWIVLFRAKHLL